MKPITRFLLLAQYWKGQQVIRSGPSKTLFRLFFDTHIQSDNSKLLHFSILTDPIGSSEFSAMLIPCPDLMALERGKRFENQYYLLPKEGSFWNDSKDTHSWVERLDWGTSAISIDKNSYKFIFMGLKLKGIFVATKKIEDDEKNSLWTFKLALKSHPLSL